MGTLTFHPLYDVPPTRKNPRRSSGVLAGGWNVLQGVDRCLVRGSVAGRVDVYERR